MNFQEARRHLLTIFERNDFVANLNANRRHAKRILIETCSNGTEIAVSFPGYKAYSKNGQVVYDYRVDITKNGITTSLSHTNIIADIYNKIVSGGMSATNLREVLVEVAKEGVFDVKDTVNKLSYSSASPTDVYKSRIKKAHGNKFYNEIGNSFDLTVEELLLSVKWIVLQEDINYPIPKYEGREMPFARYLEAIFVTHHPLRSLEEVIQRALSHSRPSPWSEMDYSFQKSIR